MAKSNTVVHLGLVSVNCGSKDPDLAHWTFDLNKVTCRDCLKAHRAWTKREYDEAVSEGTMTDTLSNQARNLVNRDPWTPEDLLAAQIGLVAMADALEEAIRDRDTMAETLTIAQERRGTSGCSTTPASRAALEDGCRGVETPVAAQQQVRAVGMGELHVWTAEDEEWVVAESPQDACAVYCSHIGCEPSTDADAGDHGTHPDHWSVLADDRPLKWADECPEHHVHGKECRRQCDPDHWIRTRLPCADHVRRNGRGYLGSANDWRGTEDDAAT